MKSVFLIITISFLSMNGFSQTFLFTSKNRTDTTVWKIKNKTKHFLLGNSTYLAPSIQFSRNKEVDISFGRTTAIVSHYGRGMNSLSATSFGVSYAYLLNQTADHHFGKLFIEYKYISPLLIGSFVLRSEYLYNLTNHQQYIRPSLGITLLNLDILYNYSFQLTNVDAHNRFKHGITIRPYLIFKKKNWERNYMVKNRRNFMID